ncbi:MAG: hypothetical protein IJ421_11265, partial [Prevotella sp.]|nr:hypothetical protein [Prevotella sp.]
FGTRRYSDNVILIIVYHYLSYTYYRRSTVFYFFTALTVPCRIVQGWLEKYRKPRGARMIFPRHPQGLTLLNPKGRDNLCGKK